MKLPVFLLLLLLGTVAAFHLGNDAPYQDSQEAQAALSQDLEGSGEQEGELVLTEEAIQSQGEQVEASSCQDAFEDEKAMESDPGALDENFQCPREEDTVTILVTAGSKNRFYRLVKTPKTFADARNTCRNCYRGTLASIHNKKTNRNIQIYGGNFHGNVWIGGNVYYRCPQLHWIDGSIVNYSHWAHRHGHGHCVTLSIKGGYWRQSCCERLLPFVCSS